MDKAMFQQLRKIVEREKMTLMPLIEITMTILMGNNKQIQRSTSTPIQNYKRKINKIKTTIN